MPNDIVNIWNAGIAEDRGDAYVIESADWNGGLAPGARPAAGLRAAIRWRAHVAVGRGCRKRKPRIPECSASSSKGGLMSAVDCTVVA